MGYPTQLGEPYSSPVGVFGRLQYQSPQEADRRRKRPPQKQQPQPPPSFTNGSPVPVNVVHDKSPQQNHIMPPPPQQQQQQNGQFGILAPTQMPAAASAIPHTNVSFANQTPDAAAGADTSHGKKLVTKLVVDPPDLQAWREKLFNVDDTIALTQEE